MLDRRTIDAAVIARMRPRSNDVLAMVLLAPMLLTGCAAQHRPASAARAPRPARAQAVPRTQAAPRTELAPRATTQPDDLQRRYGERPALDTLRGRASYYSDRLAGNRTANGDVYDPRLFTAASRELAFGTILRVVRVDTGASVIVRVNDRGPFRDRARILDLSRAAAEALGMLRAGVVEIRAEVVERPR